MNKQIGRWLFIAGLVLAVVAGLFLQTAWTTWVLAVLGLVVGFFNITEAETKGFLIAAIALNVSASAFQGVPYVGSLVTNILGYVVAFVSGAMLVVALISLFKKAST
ncbi:MAG: hypothetical protein R6U57_07325 [Anaerolineales bacterium]